MKSARLRIISTMAKKAAKRGPGRPRLTDEERSPFTVLVTAEDRVRLEEIRAREGLRSESDAARFAIRETHKRRPSRK